MRLVVVTVGAEPPASGKSQRDTNLVDRPGDCPDDLLFFMAEKSRHAEERQRGGEKSRLLRKSQRSSARNSSR